MAKIGFIGLGIMGAHMARNLIKGGHSLFLNGAYSVPEDLGKTATVVANSQQSRTVERRTGDANRATLRVLQLQRAVNRAVKILQYA